MKKRRGRPRKNPTEAAVPEMAMEKGNADFNLNDAEDISLTEADLIPPENMEELDFTAIDKEVLSPKKDTPAMAAITAEDLAFEAQLQSMNNAPLEFGLEDLEVKITKENVETAFLGDYVDGYKPADSTTELERQVYTAKNQGLTAVEATDDVIRFYTKGSFEAVRKEGYFIFKDIRVFFPSEFRKFVSRDNRNMYMELPRTT